MNKPTKEQVVNGLKTAGLIAVSVLGAIASSALQTAADNHLNANKYANASYADAVDAIVNSDMMSCHMRDAVEAIPKASDSALYSAIVAIAKGTAMSTHKRDTIESLCKNTQ